MYVRKMTAMSIPTGATFSVADARAHLAETIEAAQKGPVRLQRRGRTCAVMLSETEYERLLEAAEDVEDVAAIEEAMASGEPTIPWEQVKSDLGWA